MTNSATDELGILFDISSGYDLLQVFKLLANQAVVTGNAIKKNLGGKTLKQLTMQAGKPQTIPLTPGNLTITINIPNNSSVAGGGSRSAARGRRAGVYGPAQRKRDLYADLHDPAVIADKERYQDTLKSFQRAERQLEGKSTMDKLITAFRSTRINAGPVSPLVGRSLDALEAAGVETASGPLAGVALFVVATGAAAYGLYQLAKASAETSNAFTQFQIQTGSGLATSSRLQAIGSAAGLTPEQTGQLAQQLQERITSDPMARAAGMRLGVYNLPGMYGQQDYGKQLLTVEQHLRSMPNNDDALRYARALGVTQLLQVRQLSNSQYAYSQSDAKFQTQLFGPSDALGDTQMQKNAADFADAINRVNTAFQTFGTSLGAPIVSDVTNILNIIANWVQRMAIYSKYGIKGPPGGWDKVMTSIYSSNGSSADANYLSSTAQNASVVKDNTDATNRLTRAYLANPGIYGTINRDKNTLLPAGINGMNLDAATAALSQF